MRSISEKLPNKVYRVFSASLRYMERKSAIEGTTEPRGIPIYRLLSRYISFWQTHDVAFNLTWFGRRTCFLVVAENPEQHIHPLSKRGDPLTQYIHDQVCTFHGKKQPTNIASRLGKKGLNTSREKMQSTYRSAEGGGSLLCDLGYELRL